MKSVLLLALAGQLPFVASSSNRFAGPTPGDVWPAAVSSEALADAQAEKLRQLIANTKSVMKSPAAGAQRSFKGDGNAVDGALSTRDDQVLHTAFNQAPKGAKQGASGAPPRKDAAGATAPRPAAAQNMDDSTPSETAIDDAARAAANLSARLLASALAVPNENALPGRPVSLAEALGRGPTSQRLVVASLYWKLALALADYHWALDESLQLGAIPGKKGVVDAPLLAAAQASAHARMFEAKAAAVTVQQELADALGQPTQPLPLTVEQPLVGPYRTEFDSIFANRAAPGRSRAIHRALPHWREAIDLRSAAVQAAGSATAPVDEAFEKGEVGIESVLIVHRELTDQRRAFLNAVREYNAEIVEYASYVSGPTTSTATIVGMLTRTKPEQSTGIGSPGVIAGQKEPTVAPPEPANLRQISGEEPLGDDRQWEKASQPAAPPPM